MRFVAIFIMLFLAFPANATEEAESAQASQPKAQGTIYATLEVADDLKTEFLDGPNSELPDEIIAQVSPSMMAKARDTHRATPAEDGIYRIAIDWKIVSVNGQDQMKFEYSNSEPFPILRIEPEYSQRHATTPVEIVYRVGVAPDGSATEISRKAGSTGNASLYHAGRTALKRWKFSPQYKDGVAVAGEISLPLVFNNNNNFEDQIDVPKAHGL